MLDLVLQQLNAEVPEWGWRSIRSALQTKLAISQEVIVEHSVELKGLFRRCYDEAEALRACTIAEEMRAGEADSKFDPKKYRGNPGYIVVGDLRNPKLSVIASAMPALCDAQEHYVCHHYQGVITDENGFSMKVPHGAAVLTKAEATKMQPIISCVGDIAPNATRLLSEDEASLVVASVVKKQSTGVLSNCVKGKWQQVTYELQETLLIVLRPPAEVRDALTAHMGDLSNEFAGVLGKDATSTMLLGMFQLNPLFAKDSTADAAFLTGNSELQSKYLLVNSAYWLALLTQRDTSDLSKSTEAWATFQTRAAYLETLLGSAGHRFPDGVLDRLAASCTKLNQPERNGKKKSEHSQYTAGDREEKKARQLSDQSLHSAGVLQPNFSSPSQDSVITISEDAVNSAKSELQALHQNEMSDLESKLNKKVDQVQEKLRQEQLKTNEHKQNLKKQQTANTDLRKTIKVRRHS